MNKDSDPSMSGNDWHQRTIAYYTHSNSTSPLTTRTPEANTGYHQPPSSYPSYRGYTNYTSRYDIEAPSEDIALISPDTFRSSSQGSWNTTQSQYSPYSNSPQRNSMNSYREIVSDRSATPNGQYIQARLGTGQYYPNDQSHYQASPYNYESSLIRQNLRLQQQQGQLPGFVMAAFSKSVVGFNPKDHERIIVIESPSTTHMMGVNKRFEDYEGSEEVRSFKHGNLIVSFITLIKEPTPGEIFFDYKYRKFADCPEYYVKDPSKVYIRGPLKSNNKLKYSTKAVDRLFQIFGYHKIAAQGSFYILYVDLVVLQGIKNHFDSRVVNGKLELDFNLADELAMKTVLQDDSSDPDSPDSPEPSPVPVIVSKIISPPKRNTLIPNRLLKNNDKVHDLTSDDEEMPDADGFSIPESDSDIELYDKSRRNFKKIAKTPLSGGELIKAIDDDQDDDIMVSKSPILTSDQISDSEIDKRSGNRSSINSRVKSRETESEVIEDIDSATDQELYEEIDDDDDDDVESDEAEDYDEFEAVYERFDKHHYFTNKDVDSKLLIVRYCPQGHKKRHDFVQDLLSLSEIKFELKNVFFDSKQNETYLEFSDKNGVINGIKTLHGVKYSNQILSTVLCDKKYAKKVYV